MSAVLEKLNLLCATYCSIHSELESTFQPGLSKAEIDSRSSWFPYPLPVALYQLYQWRNGQASDGIISLDCYPLFFYEQRFLPLEDCELEYQRLMESYGSVLEPDEVGVDLSSVFPIGEFNGGWYVVPCNGHRFSTNEPFPVIAVEEDISVQFLSLERLLDCCIDWLSLSDNQQSLPTEDAFSAERNNIWEQHNPGILNIENATSKPELSNQELDSMERELLLAGSTDIKGKAFSAWINEYTTKNDIDIPAGYKPERASRYIVILADSPKLRMVARTFGLRTDLDSYIASKLNSLGTDAQAIYIVDFAFGSAKRYVVDRGGDLIAANQPNPKPT